MMENPEDLVVTLEGQVDRLKVLFREVDHPLTDDTIEVSQFCQNLECILRHQQKERMSFWGERRDYWHYLTEGSRSMRTLDTIVKHVQSLSQITTGQGRGRALVRQCLSEHLLADCLQNSISNTKRTREWYHSGAILLSSTFSQQVISALYDLGEVDFDLSLEGADLDGTWPSFVLKSFQSSDGRKSLFGPSTIEAKVADSKKPNQRMYLERAVEEHPTEIFVRQEIPFNLDLVGTLLEEIRSNLIGQNDQYYTLPELRVTKLDDITSCLSLLRDYITSWSHDIAKNSTVRAGELKRSWDKVEDLELQLQETILESESSEGTLLTHLQNSRDELKSCMEQLHRLTDDSAALRGQLSEAREKVSELEALNFALEEQLIESSSEGVEQEGGGREEVDGGRRRGYTLLETTLGEKDMAISDLSTQLQAKDREVAELQSRLAETQKSLYEVSSYPKMLQQQIVAECETKALISHNLHELESSHAKLEEKYQECFVELERNKSEVQEHFQREASISTQCVELETKNASLNSEVEGLKLKLAVEVKELNEKLEVAVQLCKSLERERDHAKEELHSMHGLVEHETQSLKFQLSSQSMELQQEKRDAADREKMLISFQTKVLKIEKELKETKERCRDAEKQVEELRQELQDVESILSSNHDEMSSLHEQLTEKTSSRDLERSQMLKIQNESETVQMRLQLEKQDLATQVKKLEDENQDIRRVFKRLLEQKVTLWQHADELEQEQVAMGTWLDSRTITECMGCGMTFTVFNRKHHCRSCGKVYCTRCCDRKAQLPSSKDPVKVCDKCHSKINQLRTPFAAKLINSLTENESHSPGESTPSDGVSIPHHHGSSNSLNIGRSVEMSGNSLQAKLFLQNSDGLPSSLEASGTASITDTTDNLDIVTITTNDLNHSLDGSGQFATAPTSINPAVFSESLMTCNSTEYIVDPELKKKEAQKNGDADFKITSVEGSSPGDSYYVIDATPQGSQFPVGLDSPGHTQLDVTALASKLASLEPEGLVDPERLLTDTLTSSANLGLSVGRANTTDYCEILLSGGGVHRVPVPVDKSGTIVFWEFRTDPKGIAFGLTYQESENGKEEEVLPIRRCMSHKATLSGEYVAQKPGVYILRFDNCHSKYTGRKLLYKVWKKPAV